MESRRMLVDLIKREVNIKNKFGKSVLNGQLGVHTQDPISVKHCADQNKNCFTWGSGTELEVTEYPLETDLVIYRVKWVVDISCNPVPWPKDCYSMSDSHWYGGAELYEQHWPMNKASVKLQPYLSSDVLQDNSLYGSVMERYFLSSLGVAIIVDEQSPLWVGMNEKNNEKLCLMAKYSDAAYPAKSRTNVTLQYDICVAGDVKTVHRLIMKKYFSKPTDIPDMRMFKFPIWSTWAQYKTNINESSVLQFANDIAVNGFKNSQIEIDDKWSKVHGDLAFDPVKFSTPADMVKKLHELGFRVTLWTTPFANVNSKVFQDSLSQEHNMVIQEKENKLVPWIQNNRCIPVLTKWWNGFAVMTDFTNESSSSWFVNRHKNLRVEYGIDSFKFDAGESFYLPAHYETTKILENPNDFSAYYAQAVQELGKMIEVRVAYRTQDLPIFVRMMDKDSYWGYKNGLKTVIPTCFLFGILGYPFILPDMIGGNAYYGESMPDEELYIRWLEVTAFLPSMQFSVSPWQYKSNAVLNIARKYTKLHEECVTPLLLKYASIATREDGTPIIRPLWWLDPSDETTLAIDDEFLIGDELLVAPVLNEGARDRDIYLPGEKNFKWRDERTAEVYEARKWLKSFRVPLDEVPYFRIILPND